MRMSDILVPKGQEDRVQRRLEKYRTRHEESVPRFEHTINGINEQQKQETLLLRQRFLEPKAKKSTKKNEKKATPQQQPADPLSTPGGGSKVPKRERTCEEIDLTDPPPGPEDYEPPAKVAHCNGGGPSTGSSSFKKSKPEASMTKFPSGGLHQPKNGANSSPSNLKSKATSNTGKGPPSLPPIIPTYTSSASHTLLHVKHESNHVSAFADLDQCAAALEKDGATSMGLIEGTPDGLIPSDTLKDLISEISDLHPEFMRDFDFEEDRPHTSTNQAPFSSLPVAPVTPSSNASSPRHVKLEGADYPNSVESSRGLSHCAGLSPAAASTASPLSHPSQTPPFAAGIFENSSSPSGANHPTSGNSTPNPTYCPQTTTPPIGGSKPARIPYTSPTTMGHDSPAAQTLKQMAEHHQHKKLGIGGGNFKGQPNSSQSHPSPARSPFGGEAYVPFNGEFVPQSQPPFGNVRLQSAGDGVCIKQENSSSGQGGIYGSGGSTCPTYPTSPLELNPHQLGKRVKSPGHSKSFTQAHLNPHCPPSFRRSYSPPSPNNYPSNQPIFNQHKMSNQPPLQHQPNSGIQVSGPGQHGSGQEKGACLSIPHHHAHYYSAMDANYTGGHQDQGQTINFTQQYLRMSQAGHPSQPPTNQTDRSRMPPRHPTGVDAGSMGPRAVPMDISHRMMMSGAQGAEMMSRFNPSASSGPPPHHQIPMNHRPPNPGGPPYYHQQVPPPQHMAPRRGVPFQQPVQENRIPNQGIASHQDNWHHQDQARSFHHSQQRPSAQQHHFHPGGMSHQSQIPMSQHHHFSLGSYSHHQSQLKMGQTNSMKNGGPSDNGGTGLILKTETESSEFNLDLLEGMGDDFSFDASSNYQNILDSF